PFSHLHLLIFLGIISGAHKNRGLGLEFLRHIERTHVLCYVIDMGATEADRDPWEDFMTLREELELYKPVCSSFSFLFSLFFSFLFFFSFFSFFSRFSLFFLVFLFFFSFFSFLFSLF